MIKKYSTRYFTVLKNLIKKTIKSFWITLKFSVREYEIIKNKSRLGETTIDLLYLMNEYGKKHDQKDEIIVHLVDNQLVDECIRPIFM